ncbi:hypothetical protein TWF106_004315 [Orbilia oligospora]|uniref:DUS-like FMN-binding domain-containing protein n=1 Tax=Orbilia oligospora TaxID=2813651 RepID=A0A7C8R0N1_ORBOL|nr:hypothetical protein TWF106_004315 [Orbilia oligospora]
MNRLLPSVRQALRLHRFRYYATMTMTDHAIAPPAVPPNEPQPDNIPAGNISADAPAAPATKYGKVVLAPMVRSGQLATRLLSLKYGADIVWGPETIDKSLIGCERVENPKTGCVDYVRTGLIFRACPSREKSKFIFQMGTAAPDTAVAAAKIVAQDVSGIDVNSGCPKPFSTHAGMGAALLKDIPRLLSILTALVENVGLSTPYALPISVKIRLLPTIEETHALVTSLCKTGISKLTLHCRTPPMRPREPAIRDALAGTAKICKEAGVEFFVNGDIKGWDDAQRVIKEYDIEGGAMIAIAAESNPSCFVPNHLGGPKPWREVVTEYMLIAMSVENPISNTKFCILNMVPGKNEVHKVLSRAKTYRELCETLGLECTYPEELDLGTLKTQRVKAQEEKQAQLQAERAERQKKLADFKRKKAEAEGEEKKEEEGSNKRVKVDVGERSNATTGAAVAELAATDMLLPGAGAAEPVQAVV